MHFEAHGHRVQKPRDRIVLDAHVMFKKLRDRARPLLERDVVSRRLLSVLRRLGSLRAAGDEQSEEGQLHHTSRRPRTPLLSFLW